MKSCIYVPWIASVRLLLTKLATSHSKPACKGSPRYF